MGKQEKETETRVPEHRLSTSIQVSLRPRDTCTSPPPRDMNQHVPFLPQIAFLYSHGDGEASGISQKRNWRDY